MLEKNKLYLRLTPFITAYDGEGNDDDGDDAGKTGSSHQDVGAGGDDQRITQQQITAKLEEDKKKRAEADKKRMEKTFTQEDVDRVVKERLTREQEKHREKQTELLSRLESLEKTSQLTDDERAALQQRIEELRSENLSSEEKATREIKRLQEELERTQKSLVKDVERWQKQYFDFRTDNELMDAALKNDARTPAQLVSLLKQQTAVKEVVDDQGRPTGRFEVRTTITDYKEDGTPFQVERKPHEAVARLAEMPEIWGNQFNSKVSAGLDRMSDQSAPVSTGSALVLDKGFDAYRNSRQKNKGVLGLK